MPIEDPTTIDMVMTPAPGRVELVITDAGLIDDPDDRFQALLAKLGAYGHYVQSGALAEDAPDAESVGVVVMCRVPPTDAMRGVEAVRTPGGEVPVRFEVFGGRDGTATAPEGPGGGAPPVAGPDLRGRGPAATAVRLALLAAAVAAALAAVLGAGPAAAQAVEPPSHADPLASAGDAVEPAVADTVPPVRSGLDLVADSNNNGVLGDADDDAAEYAEGRLGALVPFYDGCDDCDDYEEPDFLDEEAADPEPFRIEGPAREGATVRLETLDGAGAVVLWRDRARRDSVPLPLVFPATDLPLTLYVEGRAWGAPPAVLRASYDAGGGEPPVVAADTARFYSGTPSVGLWEALAPGGPWPGSVSGLPPGTPVEVRVHKNGREVQRTLLVVGEAWAPYEIDATGSAPGDVYRVEAWGDAAAGEGPRLLVAEEASVVAGFPAHVALTVEDPGPRVADGTSRVPVVARVSDADGFPVEDGTEVSLRLIEWLGEGGDPTGGSVTTRGGTARFSLLAPSTGRTVVAADVGGAESEPLVLDYAVPTLALSPDVSALDVTAGGTARVTLTTSAGPGTPVQWTVSHAAPGQPAALSTVVQPGGSSGIEVAADRAPLGLALVSARIGDAWAYTTLRFGSSAPLSAELGQRVLVGDLGEPAADSAGSVAHTYATYYEPVLGDGGRGPTAVFHRGNVRLFAATELVVRGTPHATYAVAVGDPADAALVTFDGLGPDGTVTTDGDGVALVGVRSTGAAVFAEGEALRPVAFTVRGGPSAEWTERVYLGSQKMLGVFAEYVRLDLDKDSETAWDVVGTFAGSMVGLPNTSEVVRHLWDSFPGGWGSTP